METMQEDGIDRGEIRTIFTRSHSEIKASGKRMCEPEMHQWKKLSDNEVSCSKCPTAWIVNPEVIKDLV